MFSEFENSDQIQLIATDGLVDFYPQFLSKIESQALFDRIHLAENFDQNEIVLFGKRIKVPRLEAYYALNGEVYGYSGQELSAKPFPNYLNEVRIRVEQQTGQTYNALLINYYRDGKDSNGWHADNEKELGQNPVIASVSLGASRMFHLKHRYDKSHKCKLLLESGSLLLMKGTTQHFWLHQVPKTKKQLGSRINLTFRYIK